MLANPGSHFHAAIVGWKGTMPRDVAIIYDLIDVLLMRWMGQKFKPLPRPSDVKKKRAGKSPEAALRQLRPHLFAD